MVLHFSLVSYSNNTLFMAAHCFQTKMFCHITEKNNLVTNFFSLLPLPPQDITTTYMINVIHLITFLSNDTDL